MVTGEISEVSAMTTLRAILEELDGGVTVLALDGQVSTTDEVLAFWPVGVLDMPAHLETADDGDEFLRLGETPGVRLFEVLRPEPDGDPAELHAADEAEKRRILQG
jgi:hypothetical protein